MSNVAEQLTSLDEFLAWERDIDQFGVHGLRSTRYQIYRKPQRQG